MDRSLHEQLGDVGRSPKVRAKLAEVRDRIYARAEAIAQEEKANAELSKSAGTRPRGRAYARVTASAAEEFGTETITRKRLLGRAANS